MSCSGFQEKDSGSVEVVASADGGEVAAADGMLADKVSIGSIPDRG